MPPLGPLATLILVFAGILSCRQESKPAESPRAQAAPLDWEGQLASKDRPILRPDPEASEAIFLYGAFNGWRREENVRIQKIGEEISLDACWMTGGRPHDMLGLRATMTEAELKAVWDQLHHADAFNLKDQSSGISHAMTYWVKLTRGGRTFRGSVYGLGWHGESRTSGDGDLNPGWGQTVTAIHSPRDRFAHLIRPAAFAKDGSLNLAVEPRGILLREEHAARTIQSLKSRLNANAILDLGAYRNREIIEEFVSLLDHSDEAVRGASCAVLSWCSGMPSSGQTQVWKEWWRGAKETYEPASSAWPFEKAGASGRIRRLGRGVAGFAGVERDAQGVVWGLVKVDGDASGGAYRVDKLDTGTDRFQRTALQGSYESKGGGSPLTSFVRRVAEGQIAFPDYYQGLWVSPDARWGAAILGQETKYHSDSVVVLDFEKGTKCKPFRTTHQYAGPVVSFDGRHVAVAKGWNWANPNVVVMIDTATGSEKEVPVPAADNLGPLAYVDESPRGAGFYLSRNEEPYGATPGPEEIWWCDPSGKDTVRLLVGTVRWSILYPVGVTRDGRRILVSRAHGEGRVSSWTVEWMRIPEEAFEPVLPEGVWPKSIHVAPDGRSAVFIHEGQVFEWTAPP